jgi:hypothetical protein
LIHGAPEILACPIDRQKHLIEMPHITGLRPVMAQVIGIRLPELLAPLPDRFTGHDDATSEQERFHRAVAETKADIEPDAMADGVRWKSAILVIGG